MPEPIRTPQDEVRKPQPEIELDPHKKSPPQKAAVKRPQVAQQPKPSLDGDGQRKKADPSREIIEPSAIRARKPPITFTATQVSIGALAIIGLAVVAIVAVIAGARKEEQYALSHNERVVDGIVVRQPMRMHKRTGLTEVFDEGEGWHVPRKSVPEPPKQVIVEKIVEKPVIVEKEVYVAAPVWQASRERTSQPQPQPQPQPPPPQPKRPVNLERLEMTKLQAKIDHDGKDFVMEFHNGSVYSVTELVVRITVYSPDGRRTRTSDYTFNSGPDGQKPKTEAQLRAKAGSFDTSLEWRWDIVSAKGFAPY